MDNIVEYIKSKCKNLDDMYFRKMIIKNKKVWVIFNDALVDSDLVSNYIIRSLVETINNYEKTSSEKETLKEKMGLTPSQIRDFKGLMGDPSDNLPGIPGIGEKSAIKLIQQYGSLEEIIKGMESQTSKQAQKILENQESGKPRTAQQPAAGGPHLQHEPQEL